MAAEDRFPDITREHRAGWEGFITFLKLSTAGCIALLVLMALFVV